MQEPANQRKFAGGNDVKFEIQEFGNGIVNQQVDLSSVAVSKTHNDCYI